MLLNCSTYGSAPQQFLTLLEFMSLTVDNHASRSVSRMGFSAASVFLAILQIVFKVQVSISKPFLLSQYDAHVAINYLTLICHSSYPETEFPERIVSLLQYKSMVSEGSCLTLSLVF